MEERPFHPLDYVSVVRRRLWWFVVPLVVCLAAGAALVWYLPREYYTEAEIAVTAPTLSPQILQGVSSLDAVERQRAISQQLLSRTVLERVVREEKIMPEKPIEDVVGWLRPRVAITVPKPIGRVDNDRGLDSFLLGYSDSTPERTQRITNRLAYVFVEENSRTTTARAQNTSEILAQQLAESQKRLNEIETQLRAKKEANMGRLPDQINTNVQMVNGLRQQHESLSMQLRGEQDRLSMIESQIGQMRQGPASGVMTSAGSAQLQAVQSRIRDLQTKLSQARAMGYTDKHPEVTALQQEITAARAELKTIGKDSSGSADDALASDPMYRQKLAERDAVRLRIGMLQRAEAQARADIARYQRQVELAPMVEQDMSALTREYELEQSRYADLKGKHEAAVLQESIARKQGGERFSVLYPAGLPTAPSKPNRLRILLMALAAGLALGVGLVIGREFMDRSVHDARALQTEFEVPVLGEIPRITRTA